MSSGERKLVIIKSLKIKNFYELNMNGKYLR